MIHQEYDSLFYTNIRQEDFNSDRMLIKMIKLKLLKKTNL